MTKPLRRIFGFSVLTGVTVFSQSGVAHADVLDATTNDSNTAVNTPAASDTLAKKYSGSMLKATSKAAATDSESTDDQDVKVIDVTKIDTDATNDAPKKESNDEPGIIRTLNAVETQSVACPEDDADKVLDFGFTINGVDGFDTLQGNVKPGDTVKVDFTIAEGCDDVELSLAAYDAPDATFSKDTADKQVLSDSKTGKFSAGAHSMEIVVPKCFYQVDFVHGNVLTNLGPADTDNFYEARLIDADNGGEACEEVKEEVLVSAETPDVPEVENNVLAHTGVNTVPLAATASALLLMGFALRGASRRMQAKRETVIAKSETTI